jgi:2-polyprenyl-6-methoxyphenol hydroxylase-like FAD-dependent oxidoreductase
MSSSLSPNIAIVGAGLGGLIFARVLQINGVDATVYEAEPHAHARRQGGWLDMHEDSAQLALRAAGLYEQFRGIVHPEGGSLRILDKTGTVFLDHRPDNGEGDRPEVERGALRDLLIASLDQDRIAWGHKLVGIRPVGTASHELTFADGTTTTADLVVGADGAWSRVRAFLSPTKPQYTGITMVEVTVPDAATRHPALAQLCGTGMMFALSDNKAISSHGGPDLHAAISARVPEDWSATTGIDWSNPSTTRQALLSFFPDWNDKLTDLIRASDDRIIPWPIYALPIGYRWSHTPGITLLGDAAHLMSPFAGEGANLAMLDGCELAQEILAHGSTAVSRYEASMFPRAERSARQSAAGLDMIYSATSPKEILGFFSGMAPTASR